MADEPGTQIAPTRASMSITERARGHFAPEQVDLIRATVAKDIDNAELALFLETCARHQLDPFIKEIWAYKKKGRVIIQASRDGLLGIANRHTPDGKLHSTGNGQFLGCSSDVVYEHDHFEKYSQEREDGTEKVVVDHRPRDKDGKPTHGGRDGSGRGKIVGSWARVRRLGHDDTYFFAYADQYEKVGERDGPVWDSHPHAMMQKCAESVALRKAFSISGVVGEGELVAPRTTVTAVDGEGTAEARWPEDEHLRDELAKGFEALGWTHAKVRMTLNSVGLEGGDESFEKLLERLHSEIDSDEHGEPIQDAEVVPDDEPDEAGPEPQAEARE